MLIIIVFFVQARTPDGVESRNDKLSASIGTEPISLAV